MPSSETLRYQNHGRIQRRAKVHPPRFDANVFCASPDVDVALFQRDIYLLDAFYDGPMIGP
jgi:hypothetical protein